jgi:hypothetical protein
MSIRVVEYQPPQPVAKPRQALEQSARDSLALGRSVGARLQARDYTGAVEDSIGSTVAAVEALPRPEQSPAMLGALEAHRITVTELPPPAGTEQPWQRQPNDAQRQVVGHRDDGRPILQNDDGSVSTEESITVTDPRLNDGKPTNIPSIWNGRRYDEDEAVGFAMESGQKFDSFGSIDEAVGAAQARSAGLGKKLGAQGYGVAPPGVAGIGPNGPNADFWDDAGAAPEGQEIAPGAWSYYQDIDDSGAYSSTAEYFGTFTAGFGDDTREASELARAAVARVGDPVAQAAHAEREKLHLAAASKRSQARPELIEQARRAMGLAVPSARPGKGSYPEAPDNPAEAAYGTGNEAFTSKGMKAYLGSAEARPQELADDMILTAVHGNPEDALGIFGQRAKPDRVAGKVNAQLIAAANKSPIVALGADPRNTFYNKGGVKVGQQHAYGITSGGKMLVDAGSPSTAAHESIHNGVERLMKDPKLPARFKKQLENHDQQEFITRALMIDAFGEVESEHDMAQGGEGVHPQIIRAREMLADPKWQAWIGDFKAYAARKIARDRPGGPR